MSMESTERFDYLLKQINALWNDIKDNKDLLSDFELINVQHNLEVAYTDANTLTYILRIRRGHQNLPIRGMERSDI